MKQLSKALLLVLALVLTVSVFAACSGVQGLTKESEAIGSPETVSRNKEPYSTTLIPYESVEQALGCDFEASPYYKSLNGEWDFSLSQTPELVPEGFESKSYQYDLSDVAAIRKKEDDAPTWRKISIPSNWEMKGYDAPSYNYDNYPWGQLVAPNLSETYNPVGVYRNNIEVPSDWSDRQVYVTFDGVASCVYVYVNGAMIGYAEDSYTGKTFNITDAVEFGKENLVVFEVYKYCDGSYLEANDSVKFGGIYRDVYLYAAPNTQIRDFTYDMQMSGKDALLNVNVSIASYHEPSDGLKVRMSLYNADGSLAKDPEIVGDTANFPEKPATTANAYIGDVGARISIPSPKLWSAETPNLYTVVFELLDGDDVIDTVSKRIGLKTSGVSVDDEGVQTIVVNNTPVVLRGVLYNENSPVGGMVVTKEEMITDIKLMKELNVNAVRSPGRPLSPAFIALCDEYGLYVVDDMSLNSNPYSNKDESSIPGDQTVWQTACLDRLLNVVYRDKNSASVLMWSVGNDSGTGSNFSVLRSWLSSTDTRMIVYDDDESASDVLVCCNNTLNNFVQVLGDKTNKKPVLVQDPRGALLNNGGKFSAYSDLMAKYSNFQGGFFGYWSDNALYWPTKNISETLQNTPYSAETAKNYKLTYAGGWGDTTSATTGYMGLYGVVTADRKLQSDALELKNALSPLYIALEDAATGTFRISNRNSFTSIADAYTIKYEVSDGKTVLSDGNVNIDLRPGESSTFKIGSATEGLYVYITVTYKSAPSWAADQKNLTVFEKQFSMTNATLEKDGTVQSHNGNAITLTAFQAPEVYLSSYSFSKGQMYVTNRSQKNFSDLYSVSWIVYEKHPLWVFPRWVVYDEGTVDSLDVPGGAKNKLITLPVNTDGAVSGGTYAAYVVFTSKVDIADVPAGTTFVYPINTSETDDNIPFKTDPARNSVEIEGEDGEIISVPADMDKEPEASDDDLIDLPRVEGNYNGSSVLLFENDKLSLRINSDTGMITRYAVDGKDIFVESENDPSMLANLVRNPTGGDLTSSFLTTSTLNTLKNLSQNYVATKTLPQGYKATKVSDKQYRLELEYLWVTYPANTMRTFSNDSYYTVVYDIYSSGELQVSVKYDPSVKNVAPLELSSVMTLTSAFDKMSWFGMGKGETYSDKAANGRVGVYEDVSIVDQLGSEYIYSTGSGDKTELRWLSLERADGSGVVITSDTDLFGVNVSKSYPWNNSAYPASNTSLATKNTVLRVIGVQRGVGANTLFDEEYSDAKYIVPGVNYNYSFRVIPVESGYDADKISKSVLNSGTDLSGQTAIKLNNNTFALTNAAASSSVLSSVAEGKLDVIAPLGSASQYWIYEEAKDQDVANVFRLKNLGSGLYLSPVMRDSYGVISKEAELTVAPYYKHPWQNWLYQDGQLFCNNYNTSGTGYYALHIGGTENFTSAGSRLTLKSARSDAQSKWILVTDTNDSTRVRIQSSVSGKYLTQVDQVSYANPLIQDQVFRLRNYSARISWNEYFSIASAKPYSASDTDEFVGSEKHVTQWDLLPADSQLWTFVPSNGGYMIVNKQTGNALTVQDEALVETSAAGKAEQVWTVRENNGLFGILNKATGKALTLRSVGGSNVLTVQDWQGLGIQLWSLTSSEEQKVNLEIGNNWYK